MNRRQIMTALLLLFVSGAVLAHKPSDAFVWLQFDSGSGAFDMRWDVTLQDITREIAFDSDANREITWREILAQQNALYALMASQLRLSADCDLTNGAVQLAEHAGERYLVLQRSGQCESPPTLDYGFLFDIDPAHRVFLDARVGDAASQTVLSPDATSYRIGSASAINSFTTFVLAGIEHIWGGYDHLAFLLLLALPLLAKNTAIGNLWRPLLIIVTAFTVAHSITLSAAALNLVRLPAQWVEPAIAASVILAALLNFFSVSPRRTAALAFGFGLIHGFGFAGALSEMTPDGGVPLAALAGFNLGVETGQLIVVAALVLMCGGWRRRPAFREWVAPAASIAMGVIATGWLWERWPA